MEIAVECSRVWMSRYGWGWSREPPPARQGWGMLRRGIWYLRSELRETVSSVSGRGESPLFLQQVVCGRHSGYITEYARPLCYVVLSVSEERRQFKSCVQVLISLEEITLIISQAEQSLAF